MSLIIDTDPGVDDALALMFACKSNLNILGISTVFGNSTILDSTRNALTILSLLKKRILVYEGRSMPIRGKGKRASSHGDNGLGGFSLSSHRRKSKRSAITYMKDVLTIESNKSVDLLCIGPASNVAELFIRYPRLTKKINRLIILGGVVNERGNITKYAEFNVFNDPYAFSKILEIPVKKILIPINICRKVTFTRNDFRQVRNMGLRSSINKITDIYIRYYTSGNEYGTFKGGVMYDVLTVAYLLKPSLFKTNTAFIDVCTTGKKAGMTTLKKGANNCLLATDVDAKGLKSFFFKTINR